MGSWYLENEKDALLVGCCWKTSSRSRSSEDFTEGALAAANEYLELSRDNDGRGDLRFALDLMLLYCGEDAEGAAEVRKKDDDLVWTGGSTEDFERDRLATGRDEDDEV